jgi:hypothetical protein
MRSRFVVEGASPFPVDMLRYDGCWPATEADSYAIHRTFVDPYNERIQITLTSDQHPTATAGRWKSFGWSVVKHERSKYAA